MSIPVRIHKTSGLLTVIMLVTVLALFLPAQPAYAAMTWTVSNLNDIGIGSLRNTISSAAPGDTIVFQSGLTGAIVLSSQLIIDKSLTIAGPGAGSLTISGNNQCRVFKVTGGDVSISGLTIADGRVVGNNGHYGYDGFGGGGGGGGGATAGGGGLLIQGGTVTLDSISFVNNRAIGGNGGHGGDGWQFDPSPDGDGGAGGVSDLIPGSIGGIGGHTQNGKYGGDVDYGGNYSGGGGGYGGNANYNSYIGGGDAGSGGNAYSLSGNGGSGGNKANSVFYYNKAGYGGDGGQGGGGYGGAVCLTNGALYISNGAFTGNSATGGTGGAAGSSSFQRSSGGDWYYGGSGGNGGDAKGGAIYIGGSSIANYTVYKPEIVMIVNSTFSGNSTNSGSGGQAGSHVQVGNPGEVYANGIYNRSTIGYRNLTGDAIADYAGNTYELSGVNSARSAVTASSASVSTDGGTSIITVTLKDQGGNPVFGSRVALVPTGGNPSISPLNASTDRNGQAFFIVSNTRAEVVTFVARDTQAGVTVGQTVIVTFTPGLTNAGKSTVTASPSSRIANGSDASTITVALKDTNGNPVGSGQTVTLSQNGSSLITPASGVTGNDGRAIFTVTDAHHETVTYTARNATSGVTLTQTAVVDYTPYIWSVNTLDDSMDPGTLRHAISNAPMGTAVTFQPGLAGTIELQSALPAISRSLVIDGYGASVIVSGNNQYRVFEVTSGTVSIKNLTVANGKAAGSVGKDGAVGDEWTDGNGYSGTPGGHGLGGGLLVMDGTVSIENVTFRDNRAVGGSGGNGGSSNSYLRGGGSAGNGGVGQGGAVYLANGTLTITGSRFSGNGAIGGHGGNGGQGCPSDQTGYAGQCGNGSGGAVFVNAGSLTVSYSQFSNDSAVGGNGGNGRTGRDGGTGRGGGIYLTAGTLVLIDVDFFNESVTAGAGGVGYYYANGQAGSTDGSDLYKQSGTIELSDVVFDSDPKSYYNTSPAVLEHSTVAVDLHEVNSSGVDFATITVTLRDANGIPVGSGKTVTLDQGNKRSVISPSVGTTDGNGVATFKVLDVYGETVTYTARDTTGGFTLTETITVQFLAPDSALCLVEASAPSATADGSEASTITVTLRHANGDPAPGKEVTLTQDTGHSVISPAATVTTNSSGRAVFTVTNGYAETVTYTARNTTDDVMIPGSVSVMFTPYQWVVNSLADTGSVGTLRHAISYAPAGSTISFQSGLDGTITLGSALPAINKDLIIDASGASVIISGNDQYRVFGVDGGTVSIRNLTIAHGRSAGSNGAVDLNGGNAGHAYGGGLYIAGGTVSIYNVAFNGNKAIGGRGGDGYSNGAYPSGQYGGNGGDGYGGSIYLSAGTLIIARSQFDGNGAMGSNGGNAPYTAVPTYGGRGGNGYGGAIFVNAGSLMVTESQFTNNIVAFGQGGTGGNANGNRGAALYADLYASGGTCAVSNVSFGSGSYSYYNPAPADSGQSTVTVSPSSVLSDGKAQATITVTLKFANGDPAPGKVVILSQGNGSSIITPVHNGLANNDGTASFTVTDTVAETVTYSAKDTSDNVTVAQTATVTFTPSDPASSLVSASPVAVPANASDVSTITVTLKFANGDLAAGKPVTLSQGSGHSIISPAIAITDPNGQAAFTVRNGHAETVNYTAKDTMGNVVVSQTAAVAFTPSTWVVNSLDDTGAIGTLRHAMAYAQSGTTITFQSGLNGTITLGSSLPAINKDLTIDGAGATVTISGNNQHRVFRVDGGAVSIKNLTITHGRSAGSNGVDGYPQGGNAEHGMGGGLYVTNGTVLVDNVAFNGNTAMGGIGGGSQNCYRGGYGGGGYGGAICLDAGSLIIQNSRFVGCSAIGGTGGYGWNAGGGGGNGYGGAIFASGGSLTITDSQFSSNTVTCGQGGYKGGNNGGALYADLYIYGGTCAASNVSFGSGSNSYYNPAPADAGRSTVTASPSGVPSDGKAQSTITVMLKHANGAPAPGKTVILSQGTGSSTIVSVNSGLTNNDGTATFTVTDTVAETVTYAAKDTTDNVTVEQTVTVVFTSSDPESSLITASPTTVTANGSEASTVRVTLKFANGDLATGKSVTLSQGSGHSSILPVTAITDPNGQATFTVTNGYAETVTYTAKDTMGNAVASQAVAVTFTPYAWVVSSLADTDTPGTLRHAISYAPVGSAITFQSGLNGIITLGSSLPAINRDLTIDGASATVTISGNNQCRIFRVDGGAVSIKNLTIAHGRSIGNNGSDWPNIGSGGHGMGGGLYAMGGTVSVDNVAFCGNAAIGGRGGGSIYGYNGGWGGGGYGGAIYLNAGSLTIASSRFDGNSVIGGNGGSAGSASGGGGGNGYGGAIFVGGGQLVITDSQLTNNTVAFGQGGTANYYPGSNGAALYADLYNYGGECGASSVSFGSGSDSYCNVSLLHTVTFDAQGGSLVLSIDNAISSAIINAPVTPTRSGYAFGGWYKESSCANVWNFSTDAVTSDITLYAKWTSTHSVSIRSLTGGSITASPTSATAGTTINLTITPDAGMQLKAGTLKYSDGTQNYAVDATSFTMPAADVLVTAEFETLPYTVDIATIAGVTVPVRGVVPVTTITETEQYSGAVTWSPADNLFEATTVYTATITLTPKTGYTLDGVTANFFTVVGATATNAVDSSVVTVVFPATEAAPIDIAAIAGVTVPVRGVVPVTTITETEQYSGAVTWSPADNPFGASTVYTATITLTPKTGYTLNGVTANFFTVAGATAINAVNSGVVTAVFPATTAAPIDIAAIAGVTVPVRGVVPVTTITETAQYSGAVTWSPADNLFEATTVYTATITLTPKAGYTLAGVSQNFFTVAGATAINAADSGVVTAVFPATAAAPIDIAAIADVTEPARGVAPVTTITETEQYSGAVTWSPADNLFEATTVYTATITLTPKTGYTLNGVTANFFTVAGATAINAANSGVVTAVFPATTAAPIDIAAIAGVTVPVRGVVPVTTITETAQYSGAVTWSPADNLFEATTVYTATITLTPKAGYTLAGVSQNFFTVAGATAINAADSGVVTAVFPATEAAPIDIAAIAGVTVPVRGVVPVTTITETEQYSGAVTWSPADNPFGASTVYTATITLTPKTGYTLNGVTANFFTVAGATAINAVNSGVVTAVFPATTAAPIDIAAIAGVTVPVRGVVPVTTITETAQYSGAVTWSPADNLFEATTVYTATITLTPKAGYTLAGVSQNFFTVAGATAINAADSGVVTAVFPATAAAPIDIAAIADVTEPARGVAPVTTITETEQYSGAVTWSPADNLFEATTVYTATITLTPKTGYTLNGVTANFFTVAGATAINAANSGVVTAVFPATTAAPIDIAAIAGVTVPVRGVVPVTTITETAQYSGAVTWSPADNLFEATTVYTATITLTPKAGYTLVGVSQNFFTVAGATAINAADSGVVTVVFPVTAAAPIDIAAIAGVSAPARGAVPVTTITETEQYSGVVAWSPAESPFAASTVYTATITLTPKAGYTLAGVSQNFFTVDGATAINTANSGVVTAVFPATAATLEGIAITIPASKLVYTVGDSLDISGMVVTGTYNDESTKIETLTIANVTGFNSSAPAENQMLTVTVGGKTATYTVTIKEAVSTDKTLVSITAPNDVTGVANGTEKTASALGLPNTVTLVTDDGNVSATVSWDVASSPYDPSAIAEQTFMVNGTVTLPSGVINPDSVSLEVCVSVTVNAAAPTDRTLVSVTAPTEITGVANGTAKTASALGLPVKVTLVTEDGNMQADVEWDIDGCSYDPDDTAKQTFTVDGTLSLPSGVINPDSVSLEVCVSVTVNAAAPTDGTLVSVTAPAEITGVANGAEKTALALGLPNTVTLVTDDGNVSASVSWGVASSPYDPSATTAQTFTVAGAITLPSGVANMNGVSLDVTITVTVNAATSSDKTLVNITDPSDITGVANGTEKTASALGLPSMVTLVTDGGDVQTEVTWDVAGCSYDSDDTAEQTFTVDATVTLPSGVVNTNGVSLDVSIDVTVNAASMEKALVSITAPDEISGVANGTARTAAALGLPSKVTMVTDDGNVQADVTWDVAGCSYDPEDAAEQTFTVPGMVTLPDGVVKPDNVGLTISISVTVAEATTYPLTITAGTGGSIIAGSSGSYVEGTVVYIAATSSADYGFSHWTSSNGGAFENGNSASTFFTMPAGAVAITANFTYVGGGDYEPDPPTPPTPPQPPRTVVSDHVETGDDTRLEEALREAEQPAIPLTENQAGFSAGALNALSEADVPLTLVGEEIELQLPPNWLELSEGDNAVVQIAAEQLTDEQQAERLENADLDSSTGIFEVCGKIFDLSVLVHRDEAAEELHQFAQPIAVTIGLSELGELTEEQIDQLTAVRLEVDAAGNLVPVPLGGTYNPATKTFTFNTDRFSLYSVMYLRQPQQPQLTITLTIGSQIILVNGEERTSDAAPQIENGRTLVPLRFIGETLGAEVRWNEASRTVVIVLDGVRIELPIGHVNPFIGLDVPAQLVNGRTLVPLRYITENLGAIVNWYEATRQVEIVKY